MGCPGCSGVSIKTNEAFSIDTILEQEPRSCITPSFLRTSASGALSRLPGAWTRSAGPSRGLSRRKESPGGHSAGCAHPAAKCSTAPAVRSPRPRVTVHPRWTSPESGLDPDSRAQLGQAPEATAFLKASRAGKVLVKTAYSREERGRSEEAALPPLPCLICSGDRRDGCVQAGGKGCISGVSWAWTPCLWNWPGLFCFWPLAPGFFLCLLARSGLRKSLWEELGEG